MATVDNSRITSEASGILDCFVSGLDEVVYEIAEGFAKRRCGHELAGERIEIDTDDVKAAGRMVLSHLRELVESGKLPAEVALSLSQVENRFGRHCD